MPNRYTLASEFTRPAREQSLLAALATSPETYWEILDCLTPEAFTTERPLFEKLVEAVEQDSPLPVVHGEPAADPHAVAQELAGLYQKRLLADLGRAFLEALREDTSATELITQLEEQLSRIQQAIREFRSGQVMALPDLFPEMLRDIRARHQAVKEHGKATVGLPTGITRLDNLLGGLQPGLHLLAAEPGMGKTMFALQVAAHVAQEGVPVLFVSFEESLPRLALKAVCSRVGLEAKRFTDGYEDPETLAWAMQQYGPALAKLYLIEGTARLSVAQVKAKALQVMHRSGTKRCLIIVDYLQRWAASRRDFADFRHVVSGLVSDLRELALRLDSPIVVISSQNRLGQGSAKLVSLKESGDIEYSADTALFLVEAEKRTATPPARAVDLVIEKNRYGDKGKVDLIFRPQVGLFREEERP
jgi:replicative DNA helicase